MPKSTKPSGIGHIRGRARVTMHDIARVAGCSQPTVSFVLNGNTGVKISEATKRRVLLAANDLDYILPDLAKSKSKPFDDNKYISGPIAFVVDSLSTSPEAVHAFDGVTEAVKATGNIVLLAETGNDPCLEPKVIRHFIEQKVSAIVYACIFTRKVAIPQILSQTDIPVFLLNCYSNNMEFPAVVPGEVSGGHTATNALIELGHKRIATITGEMFMEAASDRLRGYRNALATADLPFCSELVIEGNWLPSSGYSATRVLMSLSKPPTAIFCQNDRMAIGCYEALKEMRLRIPEDISIIGYDDDEVARHLSPPLTSMNLASRALGRWVIEQLFHGQNEINMRHPLTKLECELVERDSISSPNLSI